MDSINFLIVVCIAVGVAMYTLNKSELVEQKYTDYQTIQDDNIKNFKEALYKRTDK